MNTPPLHGLITATFTPMKEDGSLALDRIPAYADFLARNGIAGAFVNGTTGEGASLTTAERKQIAETWVAAAPPDLRVIVHVGHNSLEEARDLAAHAQQIGAFAFAALAPSFFKPGSVEALVATCAHIASAAPGLPFYYYHIPSMTGVTIPCLDFLKAAKDRIPNLRGIKFTFENLMDYLACLRFEDGRLDMVFGRDEALIPVLALGAQGAIGSTYNFLGPQFQKAIATFRSGDLTSATAQQSDINDVIAVMIDHGGLAAGKAMMALLGQPMGPVRLPLRTVSGSALERLRTELSEAGFPDSR